MGFLLIVLTVFVNMFEGIFIKRYNAKYDSGGFAFTAIISLFSMIFFILTNRGVFDPIVEIVFLGILGGLLFCSAMFFTFIALGCGSYALSVLILSYGILFSVVYGIVFLHEPTTIYTYIGLLLVVISLFFTRPASDVKKTKVNFKWIVAIGISVFCSGMFEVLMRVQQFEYNDVYSNEFMIISLGTSAIVLLIAGFIKDGKKNFDTLKNCGLYAAGAGLSNGMTSTLSLIATAIMPISIVSPTRAGIKILFSFLLSVFFYKEKFLKRQVFGVALGAVALVFLNI